MKVRYATETQLHEALAGIQKKYEDNLLLDISSRPGYLNIRLKVKDSQGPGARHTTSYTALRFACWHATGDFVDSLFEVVPDAILSTRSTSYRRGTWCWEDWNAGSQMQPHYMSDLCVCEKN